MFKNNMLALMFKNHFQSIPAVVFLKYQNCQRLFILPPALRLQALKIIFLLIL